MSRPTLTFVRKQEACGIAVHSLEALNWLLRVPPPAKIPVFLSRDLYMDLQEITKSAPTQNRRAGAPASP